jgi:hypothetical protein
MELYRYEYIYTEYSWTSYIYTEVLSVQKNILESFIQINIKKMVLIPLFIIGVSFKVGMMIG